MTLFLAIQFALVIGAPIVAFTWWLRTVNRMPDDE